jgi:1,4-dihydroxy-2-naphthoate polyprenyltransferase
MKSSTRAQPLEPTAAAFGGGSRPSLKKLILAARPAFFPASVAPVIVGSAWGYRVAGHFDWLLFVLALLATLCVHLGSNVINDVGDDLTGADRGNDERIFPYTGGSRFIQNQVLSIRQMTIWGVTLLGIGALLGLVLVTLRGPAVLFFGLIGVALGVLYSLPRVQLSAHGVGEAAIAIAFGLLPVSGAAWLQSGHLDWQCILISVPVSLWVAAILLINEVPDKNADGRAGKRTLVVRFGVDSTRRLYLALQLTAIAAVIAAGALRLIPWWAGLAALLLLPLALKAARGIREPIERASLTHSIELTLRQQAGGCMLLFFAILLATFLGRVH